MKIDKDELGIIGTYFTVLIFVFWFTFSPREIGPSGEVVLTDIQLILFTFSIVIFLVSGVITLILGLLGLSRPRYGKPLVLRQYIIYWVGISPTVIFTTFIVGYGVYVFFQANI